MTALSDFLAMGGYADFVWTAYGVVAAVLVGLVIVSRRELCAREQQIEALEAASPRRRARTGDGAS